MGTNRIKEDQLACTETQSTELKPGLGFTEDTRHVLLSNIREAVTDASPTELNNSNASQNCLSKYETVTTCTNYETVSTVTEVLAYSNGISKMCSHVISSENVPSSKSKTHGTFAVNGNKNYDNVKELNEPGENKLYSVLADGLNEELTESDYDKFQAPSGDDRAYLDEDPIIKDPVPTAENRRTIRKGNNLSTYDLEEDTIRAASCKQVVLKDSPDCVPDDLPRVTLHKSSGPRCLIGLPNKPTIRKTEIYIQHERATESQLGDKFGASVETWSTHATGYHEHFFTDIEQGGVADHMKIKYGDQLVLLNGIFVPNFSHKEVLQQLSTVPVDSHTRLSLIILRSVSKRTPWEKTKWVWIDTSAILVPEYDREPAVIDPVYSTSHGSSHEERGVFKLKVQGTQLYVSISDGHVGLEVSESGDDEDRFNICVWTRCTLDALTAQILYTACLYKKDPRNQYQNNYVNIIGTAEVKTKTDPQWFGFGLLGSTQSFKDNERNKWLSCYVTNQATCGKFCLQKDPFYFAAYSVKNEVYLRSDRQSDKTAMGTDERVRSNTYSEVSHRERSSGLNINNEGTDIDVPRGAAYGSKQSVSADSGYSTDSGIVRVSRCTVM